MTIWDTVNRAINALLVAAALLLVWGIAHVALEFKPAPGQSVADVVTMTTSIGGVIVSLVGVFFGVNLARQGIDAAKSANTATTTLSAALQAQQGEAASMRGAVAGGLDALKHSAPPELHAAIDAIAQRVGS